MLNTLAGIIASSGGAAAGGDFESIATVTVGAGGSSTVTFSSIPSTYTHLQVRGIFKGSATDGASPRINFNSDSGANYAYHYLTGNGASANAGNGTSTAFGIIGVSVQSINQFSAVVLDILDYANTNKYKTVRDLIGYDNNGSGIIALDSSLWMSTNAINSITITAQAANFVQHSSFALYGIKG